MNTYHMAILAGATWAGTLSVEHPVLGVVGFTISLVFAWAFRAQSWKYLPLLALLGLLAGGGVATIVANRLNQSPLWAEVNTNRLITIHVELRDDPGRSGTPGTIRYAPHNPSIIGEPIWVSGELTGYAGTVVEITGRVATPSTGFSTYLARRGIIATVRGSTRRIRDPTTWWDRSTAQVHQQVALATRHISRADAGLLLGLALGDERQISEDDRNAMKAAGLSHLTAVSGSNVAMVVGATLALAWVLVLGRQVGRCLALIGLWWFVWLVRAEPSVLRAAVMATLVIGAGITGRPPVIAHSLAVTVVGALLLNPLLGQQVGFALSVMATAGVLAGVAAANHIIGPDRGRIVTAVVGSIGASIGANLATLPVLALAGLDIQPVSPWANVVVASIATLAQWGAVATTTLALVHDTLASWCAQLTVIPIRGLLLAAHWFADPSRIEGFVFANWVIVIISVVAVANHVLTGWITVHARNAAQGGIYLSRGRFVLLVFAALVAIRFLPLRLWVRARQPLSAQFITLDVGQGDALLVSDPNAGWIMIDTGPDPKVIASHLDRLGIRDLQAVVISHAHADHTGGLERVLTMTRCTQVMVSPDHVEAEAPRTINVRKIAQRCNVPITAIAKGDRITFGSVTMEVLHPARSDEQLEPNDASVVLRITGPSGIRVLATGDAEEQAQWAVASTGAACDVLKVPHHGGDTNATGFLTQTGAHMAIISCGTDNDYGHPHANVLHELTGMQVHRTDLHGSCVVPL